MEADTFFYAAPGELIPPDEVVLACYELAHFYHVDPQTFLVKPMSELARTRYWTGRLSQRIREAQEAAESSDG